MKRGKTTKSPEDMILALDHHRRRNIDTIGEIASALANGTLPTDAQERVRSAPWLADTDLNTHIVNSGMFIEIASLVDEGAELPAVIDRTEATDSLLAANTYFETNPLRNTDEAGDFRRKGIREAIATFAIGLEEPLA